MVIIPKIVCTIFEVHQFSIKYNNCVSLWNELEYHFRQLDRKEYISCSCMKLPYQSTNSHQTQFIRYRCSLVSDNKDCMTLKYIDTLHTAHSVNSGHAYRGHYLQPNVTVNNRTLHLCNIKHVIMLLNFLRTLVI